MFRDVKPHAGHAQSFRAIGIFAVIFCVGYTLGAADMYLGVFFKPTAHLGPDMADDVQKDRLKGRIKN